MASADPTLEPYCITEGFLKPAERIQQRCTRLFSRQPTTLLAGNAARRVDFSPLSYVEPALFVGTWHFFNPPQTLQRNHFAVPHPRAPSKRWLWPS
jgi:hypothetical protein